MIAHNVIFGTMPEHLRLVNIPDGVVKWKLRQRPAEWASVFFRYESGRIEEWWLEEVEPGVAQPAILKGENSHGIREAATEAT